MEFREQLVFIMPVGERLEQSQLEVPTCNFFDRSLGVTF